MQSHAGKSSHVDIYIEYVEWFDGFGVRCYDRSSITETTTYNKIYSRAIRKIIKILGPPPKYGSSSRRKL